MTTTELQRRYQEARTIIWRMLNDWPYQPPEVIEPEQHRIKAWLDKTEGDYD